MPEGQDREVLARFVQGDPGAWGATDDRMPAPPASDAGVGESLALAFRRLPPKLQVVATLALVEEQPYAEIADARGLPVGTVKSRVFRAVHRLRSELTAMGIRP
jgi:DNA-directed RNA polymerase specialized sigma24 family protein